MPLVPVIVRPLRALAVHAALAALLVAPAPAQPPDAGRPLGPVERGTLDFLLTLPDDHVQVRYTPGSLDRAARLQYRLKDLYLTIDSWTPIGSPFAAFVLTPEEWRAQGLDRPYGMAQRVAAFGGAVPAWGTPETVALWSELAGVTLDGSSEFTVRGSAEEVATVLLSDALLELELCRMVALNRGIAAVDAEPWMGDLVGHILCTTARRRGREPPPVDLTSTLRRLRAERSDRVRLDLAGFDRTLEPERWLAYQARFVEASERVWASDGKKGPRRLIKRWRKKGAPLAWSDLAELFPALAEWRANESSR